MACRQNKGVKRQHRPMILSGDLHSPSSLPRGSPGHLALPCLSSRRTTFRDHGHDIPVLCSCSWFRLPASGCRMDSPASISVVACWVDCARRKMTSAGGEHPLFVSGRGIPGEPQSRMTIPELIGHSQPQHPWSGQECKRCATLIRQLMYIVYR